MKTFYEVTQKISFIRRRKSQIQTYFDSQSHSSHNENKGVETSVPEFSGILPEFSEILPVFSTNQNFWIAPLHHRLLHHCILELLDAMASP